MPNVSGAHRPGPTRVVIHQSYFLPWLGYLSKLARTDVFVVLDDVYFRKRHYFDRTKITDMHGNLRWLGLPLGERYQVPCNQITLTQADFVDVLISTIRHSYAKARCFEESFDAVRSILQQVIVPQRTLVEINMGIVQRLLGLLDITPPKLRYSSDFSVSNDPTKRVIELCGLVGANELLLGMGKSAEVHDLRAIKSSGISVVFEDYFGQHPTYSQSRRRRLPFVPGLSSVDALFNVGRAQTRRLVMNHNFARSIRLR